jgi:type I restriction enzyme M protein
MNMMTSSDLAAEVGAECQGTNKLIGRGLTINDPACGSGRMLIAFHAKNPGNYVFGEDLDPMCCKMACINLMIHGCEGEIVNHNSLQPDDYIQGWSINADIRKSGLPSIRPLAKENSFVHRMWHKAPSGLQQEKVVINVRDKKKIVVEQLGIFS